MKVVHVEPMLRKKSEAFRSVHNQCGICLTVMITAFYENQGEAKGDARELDKVGTDANPSLMNDYEPQRADSSRPRGAYTKCSVGYHDANDPI